MMGIDETLGSLLVCITAELEKAGRGVCDVGETVGEPTISECCECDESGKSGSLWGSFTRMAPRTLSGNEARNPRPCAPRIHHAEFKVTLFRCFPRPDERGELPDSSEYTQAARELHADVAAIERAVQCCKLDGEAANVAQINVTRDPTGGCSSVVATILAPVSASLAANGVD